jgi:hypothetical protein
MNRNVGVLIFVVAAFGALSLRGDNRKPRDKPNLIDPQSRSQLIFFAVVEGCYEDGLSTADVDQILGVDPRTKQLRYSEHFVGCCPLCMPAFDAFQLYRSRPRFYGLKEAIDKFGPGLEPDLAKKLHSDQKADQLEAIQNLVNRWVSRRLDSMRLTKDEREQWTAVIEEGRRKGMQGLQQAQAGNQNEYVGWKGCAICDGSAGASQTAR